MGMVTRRGVLLSAVGMALGLPLAYGIHRAVLQALNLFDVDLGYNMALLAGGLLAATAVLASYLPARAAASVEATQALSLE